MKRENRKRTDPLAIAWKKRMDEARGLRRIDLVLRRARLVNVLSGEVYLTEIGVHQGRFLGSGTFSDASEEVDLEGRYLAPGLIDGHVHIESSYLCPEEFCSLLLAHGVTTAVVDPHEIANVAGAQGIRYILNSLAPLPFNGFVALPSCVPATRLETSGARLEAEDLRQFLSDPQVIGLGEVMDYQAVLDARPEMVAKLSLPVRHRDGHAPGMRAQDLNAYFLAGINTDHECTTPEEALEHLRRGFYVMLRQGSVARNLLDLLPAVTDSNASRFLLVTDDCHAADLQRNGSIDHLVRLAIKAGVPPVRAVQMATINAANAFGLPGLGAVAPGYQADFVVLNDLERMEIEAVYHQGRQVGACERRARFRHASTSGLTGSVNLGNWSMDKLAVPANRLCAAGGVSVRVMGVGEHSLITASLIRDLPVREGLVLPDPGQGIAKIAVLERHQGSGRVGVGFVEGLGLKNGAIASTVAHDSHNLVVAGMSDAEMDLAVRTCVEMGGGLCLVRGERVLGRLPLPIAGLMTEQLPEEVTEALDGLHFQACPLGVGSGVDVFMTLSFLSLPAIPALKLTDLGLVDVEHLKITSLLVDDPEEQ